MFQGFNDKEKASYVFKRVAGHKEHKGLPNQSLFHDCCSAINYSLTAISTHINNSWFENTISKLFYSL